jgi:hypothetical protein
VTPVAGEPSRSVFLRHGPHHRGGGSVFQRRLVSVDDGGSVCHTHIGGQQTTIARRIPALRSKELLCRGRTAPCPAATAACVAAAAAAAAAAVCCAMRLSNVSQTNTTDASQCLTNSNLRALCSIRSSALGSTHHLEDDFRYRTDIASQGTEPG